MMKRLALLMCASTALAQPAEQVTVTGVKEPPRLAAEHFVERFTVASPVTGKAARWDEGVCPVTVGLGKKYAAYITANLRAVAKEAGAPVNTAADCKPNIEIVFTTAPQKMADNIRKEHPSYLGYASDGAQREALANVTHPIQAWYLTAAKDLDGHIDIDNPNTFPMQAIADIQAALKSGGLGKGNSGVRRVTGGRLDDGVRSILYHVIIVAEPAKLGEYEMGTLADYIALIALSQVASLDDCQPLGSIINLLAKGCANAPAGLTEADKSYLAGLYRMSPDGNLRMQQDGIAQVMLDRSEK